MTKRPLKNVADSVYNRLKNKARETNRRFGEWLRRFAMERFLYRLCQTPHIDQFVLKGALLLKARIPMQIDVGCGTVTPSPILLNLPAILDYPSPRLQVYTRESAVSEKFHAMVRLNILNSRMKDFFDV